MILELFATIESLRLSYFPPGSIETKKFPWSFVAFQFFFVILFFFRKGKMKIPALEERPNRRWEGTSQKSDCAGLEHLDSGNGISTVAIIGITDVTRFDGHLTLSSCVESARTVGDVTFVRIRYSARSDNHKLTIF